MKGLLAAIIVTAALLAPTAAATPAPTAPVDFNGDCAVSIGDFVISFHLFGNVDYAAEFLAPAFGTYGPEVCGFDVTPYLTPRKWND